MTFADLNLNPPLLNALEDLGLQEPTVIQQKAFSVIMSGRDVVGIAQTGTGKTYAYLLPLLRQYTFSKQKEPRILILVPTRELVVQMVEEVKKLSTYLSIRVEGVYGGTNINTQKQLVSEGLDLLVATPGRLLDLALTGYLNLKFIKHLVIDEMDEMLSLGFRAQLLRVFDLLPKKRQNLLFSATMSEDVDDMINEHFRGPILVEAVRAGTPLERIEQTCYQAPNFYSKINLLAHLLEQDESMQKVLIFGPSRRLADLIYNQLEEKFADQFEIVHANKSQNFRLNAVAAFEKGLRRGLICTDVLARGLDVTDVTHVINVDTPEDPETYIHRIGRTGRADKDGKAVLFTTEAEQPQKEAIETLMGRSIPEISWPEEVEVSLKLIESERFHVPEVKLKLRPKPTGAFHDKLAKNKKVNKGNKTKHLRDLKYKKPKSKGKKR
ncbi:MAG TPA: DEAD/DEAH box helicase [Saprospiraceae bacterium]|nr:DEAD/DEAH box helicase [Saprospiraceae bacterium]